jgi:hypothetical protein
MDAMKRAILHGLLAMLVLLLVVYVGDYCSLRYQVPGGRPQFGQITVDTLYAIHEKNGKTEYELGEPRAEPCVRSLFPHLGCSPCWYAGRHTERRIDI